MSNAMLYILSVLIWGSTWFAIEFQLGVVAPEVSLVYRYGAAALMLFGWCLFRGHRLRYSLRAHGWFFALGVMLFGINYIIVYHAQLYITSALTAIAFTSLVWMNIINARLFFGVRSGPGVLIGALLGVIGIIVLFAPRIEGVTLSDDVFLGCVLVVLSALVASFGNMVSQGAQKASLPVVPSNAWGMFYGALATAVLALLQGHQFTFDWSTGYVISLAYLTVFGSVLAFGAYLTLLGRIGAAKAGYAMVLFPVVALVLSMLFEGLRIDLLTIAGTTLVLVGNLFVLGPFWRSPETPQAPATAHSQATTGRPARSRS